MSRIISDNDDRGCRSPDAALKSWSTESLDGAETTRRFRPGAVNAALRRLVPHAPEHGRREPYSSAQR